jgi:uncharacterized membrane protein YtjA (UPF0391 family)
MAGWAIAFLLAAIVAATLGITGFGGEAEWIAKTVFIAGLVMFVGAMIAKWRRRSIP